jgi:hypothetical protein
MYSPPPDTPRRKGIHMCQQEGNTYVSAGREYRRVKRRGIHMCQQEGNTGVSGGGEYICVKRKGIQSCQEEGNTYESEGREYICVSGDTHVFLLTHMYSPPADTHGFPSF